MNAKIIAITAALVVMIILFMTCGGPVEPKLDPDANPPLGKNITVQFKRDALGAAASSPVPPMSGMHNGAETSIAGTLKNVTPEWIVLDRNGSETWIPKTAILLLHY
jgi:hypothetical protein